MKIKLFQAYCHFYRYPIKSIIAYYAGHFKHKIKTRHFFISEMLDAITHMYCDVYRKKPESFLLSGSFFL